MKRDPRDAFLLVRDRVFKDETVELDGRFFQGCTFDACTLVLRSFNGFEASDCLYLPGCKIEAPGLPAGAAELLWSQIWNSAALKEQDGIVDH